MVRERYANDIETTLVGDINASVTAIVVGSSTSFPAVNFRARIDDEIVLVSAVSHPNWTIARAQEGTTGATHNGTTSPARIVHVLTAAGLAASSGPMTTRGDLIRATTDGAPERVALGATGKVISSDGTDVVWTAPTRDIVVIIDGGGSEITTGVHADVPLDFACTITGWTLVADQSGSIVIDVWKDTYANYPPTVADTIAGSEKPTLATATKNQDLTLTTWTTAVASGDTLRFNVDSVTTVTRVALSLRITVP